MQFYVISHREASWNTYSPLVATRFALEPQLDCLRLRGFDCYEIREATWKEVEREMWKQGLRKPPVWQSEMFWRDLDHYAHIFEDDPKLIEFTNEHGRLVPIKPGKYLNKFFPNLSKKQVAFYAEWHVRGERPVLDIGAELKFATKPGDIVSVYERGPNSCMKGSDSVQVYGAGDLAIAYLERDKQIIARTLCWPEKKVFGRVYPNLDSWRVDGFQSQQDSAEARDHLFDLLRRDGYKHTLEGGSLDGARLLKIQYHGYRDRVVMPYLDHGGFRHEGGALVLDDEGNFSSEGTSGWADITPPTECHHCEAVIKDEYRVRARNFTIILCDCCYETFSFYCDATGDHFYEPEVPSVVLADGMVWNEPYFIDHGFYDPTTGDAYPNAEGVMWNNQLHHPSSILELAA